MKNASNEVPPDAIELLRGFLNDVCSDDSGQGFVRKLARVETRWVTVQDYLAPFENEVLKQIAFQATVGGFSTVNLKAHFVLDEDFVNAGSAFVLFSLVAGNWTHVVAVSNQNKFTSATDWLTGIRA